jgi:hypothetical protein
MITNFKLFESERQFREVDLQQLWDDLTHNYYSKLFDKPMHTDMFFHSLLKRMLIGKDIEFNRVENRFDGEVLYNFSGKIEDVEFVDETLIKGFILVLNEGETKYLLTINNKYSFERTRPVIVKIYDSEESEIEKKLNFLKTMNKYNI